MPQSTHVHKSMLLRGVDFGAPALDRSDIEATKGRANRSGRSYGGAPLRGDHGNGRGRGGQINYADSRPNPFAAHINPAFPPQGIPDSYRGRQPSSASGGWAPAPGGPDSFRQGPPAMPSYGGPPYGYPPPPHSMNHGRPPTPSQPSHYHHNPHANHLNQYARNGGYHAPTSDGRYGNYSNAGR